MTRALWLLVALTACDNANTQPDRLFDVDAAWQVRCPGCTYPERQLTGAIDFDNDPDRRAPSCTLVDGFLDVDLGVATFIDPQHTEPGYDLSLSLGYDPATGFDLARNCQVNVGETDDRLWGKTCSDLGDCTLVPAISGDELTFTLRCVNMPSIPAQAGNAADLTGPGDAQATISGRISPCPL